MSASDDIDREIETMKRVLLSGQTSSAEVSALTALAQVAQDLKDTVKELESMQSDLLRQQQENKKIAVHSYQQAKMALDENKMESVFAQTVKKNTHRDLVVLLTPYVERVESRLKVLKRRLQQANQILEQHGMSVD